MELNAEQVIKALECCVKVGGYRDAQYCNDCPLHEEKCATLLPQNALALINSQEQKIKELTVEYDSMAKSVNEASDLIRKLRADKKELTEENERLRGVGLPDDETYIKLSDAKHAIMDYIGEQTVSKYTSSAECKAARGGAEGAMNELDYIAPAQVAPIADTVRKMQELVEEKADSCDIIPINSIRPIDTIYQISKTQLDQIAKEMLEG